MASNSVKLSYVETLPVAERTRYQQKLAVIDGLDPYQLPKHEWKTDASLYPAVTYPDIVNYLILTSSAYTLEDLKAYKSLEAYNQFVCGWVRDVVALVKNGHHLVAGKVLHSQSLREKPLRPWLISTARGNIVSAHCDCKAGLGEACSHVAALLFWIEASVRIRDSKTVTEEKAYWKLPAPLRDVEYRPIRDLDFTSAKSKRTKFYATLESSSSPEAFRNTKAARVSSKSNTTPETSTEELNSFFKEISKLDIKPAILSIVAPYSDMYVPKSAKSVFPRPLTDLYDPSCTTMPFESLLARCTKIKIEVDAAQAKTIEQTTKSQAKSNLWYQFRAGRITASKFKVACHTEALNPSKSLIKAICYPGTTSFSNAATTWGCHNEPVARQAYWSHMVDRHIKLSIYDSGLIINPIYPYMGASPDAIIVCDCCGTGCVEIKCPFSIREETLSGESSNLPSFLQQTQHGLQLKSSHQYFYQIQCQMNIGSFDFCDFVVWTQRDMHIERIQVDHTFFEENAKLAAEFFRVGILPELVAKFYSKQL